MHTYRLCELAQPTSDARKSFIVYTEKRLIFINHETHAHYIGAKRKRRETIPSAAEFSRNIYRVNYGWSFQPHIN